MLELFPILRDRLDEPAGNLSGGQQQMLALGMAFIEQPRLLMIDELSLGLAPTIVEQLLPIVRDIAAQGTTIILVEQSVNLALTIAETAYFMEKGEIRFHGPTAELLERPDVLRSVFLEGARHARRHARRARRRPRRLPRRARRARRLDVPAHVDASTPQGNGARRARGARDPPRARQRVEAIRRARGADRRVVRRPTAARSSASSDRTAPARRRCSTRSPGSRSSTTGRSSLGEGDDARRRHAHAARDRAPGSGSVARSRTVACSRRSPSPRRSRSRSNATSRCATRSARRCACRSSTEAEADTHARVEELLELLGITDFRDKLGARALDREPAHRRPRVRPRARPSVLLLDEPSSGIAQREAEALGPLLLRIREQTGATLLVIEHDVPLLLSVSDRLIALDLGEIVASGAPTTSCTIQPLCSRTSVRPKPRSPAVAIADRPEPRRTATGANPLPEGINMATPQTPRRRARRWRATRR